MNSYYVRWQTEIGMGATFYKGTERVWADTEDEARDRAQHNVSRRGFRDWPQSHIRIVSILSTNDAPPTDYEED